MRVRAILAVGALVLGSMGLAGCMTDPSQWTAADWAAYNQIVAQGQRDSARMAQQSQAILNSTSQFQLPVVGSYQQPNGTMIYYCRDLTGSIVACRQVN